MQDLTFKKPIIYSAFEKSSLYPFNPSTVLEKLKEFSTLEQTLAADDLGLELGFEVDFQRALTLMSPRIYKAYTSYIDKKLAQSIEHGMTLTPTTGKLITKRKKAHKINLLTGKLAIKELFKRQQAELDKVRLDGERIVQQFETILVGDARLRTMTQNLEEERKVDALQAKKAESLHKKNRVSGRGGKASRGKGSQKSRNTGPETGQSDGTSLSNIQTLQKESVHPVDQFSQWFQSVKCMVHSVQSYSLIQ